MRPASQPLALSRDAPPCERACSSGCWRPPAPWGAEERDTYAVKSAFREVVREVTNSTVRVLCDGRRAALGAIVEADGFILTKASELKGEVTCQLWTAGVWRPGSWACGTSTIWRC